MLILPRFSGIEKIDVAGYKRHPWAVGEWGRGKSLLRGYRISRPRE